MPKNVGVGFSIWPKNLRRGAKKSVPPRDTIKHGIALGLFLDPNITANRIFQIMHACGDGWM